MSEKVIILDGISLTDFLGPENKNITQLSNAFPSSKIVSRGDEIKLIGNSKEIKQIGDLIELLIEHYNRFGKLTTDNVQDYIDLDVSNKQPDVSNVILFGNKGIAVKPKTANQKKLVSAIAESDVTFAIGPAGTGKTYVAVAMAVDALKKKKVKKIIITRPVVEAGESLGFLPGDLKEKIDPYLRPIYDALYDLLPAEKLNQYMESRVIEIAPLAYMRGRTLSDAFVLLDEAQNTTSMQLKMFLTRLGVSSKMVITGDISQIDLPKKQQSGLVNAMNILQGIKGISWVKLDGKDVVRHRVVKQIISAFEKEEEKSSNGR